MREKSGTPLSKKPREGRPPKPREEKVEVCPYCEGFGVLDNGMECRACEGTGEVYET